MKPAVSIILPVYNAEPFLDECLETITAQTLQDIEIVCVNDGSTDASLAMLQKWAQQDSRIAVIDQPNQGVSAARNNGINVATGDYVMFCDPDDRLASSCALQSLYDAAVAHGAAVAAGNFIICDEDTGELTEDFSSDLLLWGYTFQREGFVAYRDWQFDYGFHRFMFKREFLLESPRYFPPYIRYQDPVFLVKALAEAEKFYAVPVPVYKYRLGHKEVGWSSAKRVALVNALADVLAFSRENGLAKLHSLTFERMNVEYGGLFQEALEDELLFAALVDLNPKIDWDMLTEAQLEGCLLSNGTHLIQPLRQQKEYAQRVQELREAIKSPKKLFSMGTSYISRRVKQKS